MKFLRTLELLYGNYIIATLEIPKRDNPDKRSRICFYSVSECCGNNIPSLNVAFISSQYLDGSISGAEIQDFAVAITDNVGATGTAAILYLPHNDLECKSKQAHAWKLYRRCMDKCCKAAKDGKSHCPRHCELDISCSGSSEHHHCRSRDDDCDCPFKHEHRHEKHCDHHHHKCHSCSCSSSEEEHCRDCGDKKAHRHCKCCCRRYLKPIKCPKSAIQLFQLAIDLGSPC